VRIAEPDVGGDDLSERRPPAIGVGLVPAGEPRRDRVAGTGEGILGDDLGKPRELVPPALDVRVAGLLRSARL